ncbi:hypothetical protein FF86_10372 [Frankia sp. CpI1-P]|uniref:winged helix-turn-helix domain-containing protein n=1 Tax=Frankia sp. CpI1-P TaxID=1502734 RepID=UPI00070829BA|nr:winged helix-turn-helix domain-containing protein [Frankia sp. CpI1-P]KQM03595.1 hypothetical protein FF86_10372 [Frankia sp. CpI1-P]
MPSNNADTATADTTRVLTALVDGPLSAPDIATRTGIEVRTVRNLLASLADAGRIRQLPPEPTPGRAGRHAARWALPATGTTDRPARGEPEGASPAPAPETSTPDPDTTAPTTPEADPAIGGADSPADDETDHPAADLPTVSEPTSEPQTGAEEPLDGGPDDTPTGADAAVAPTTAHLDAATGSADGGPGDVASPDPATVPEPAAVSAPVCAALACPLAACPARTGVTPPAPRRRARAPRAATGTAQLNASGSVRLRPGQLGGLIGDLLRDNPTAQLSSGEIARELERSSGAVAAAMPGLINAGRVRQVNPGERPARYQTTGKS